MASTSSIGRAGSKGSAITTRPGVATWWRAQKGDLAKDAIISVVVGVALFLGACWWDARLQARQDALASAIADRQDDLAQDLANHAEVLENTRLVRQIATSGGWRWKPFASINLGGAELGGLQLPCVRRHVRCADFLKADLHEANLDRTALSGGSFEEADLHKATLNMAQLSDAHLLSANLDGVGGERASFDGADLGLASLVQARLDHANFTDAGLGSANADEAILHSADFRNAHLLRSHFKRADLRDAIRGAEIIHVDLTSTDLRDANFTDAKMIDIDLTSADLRGADFTGTHLRRAVLTDVCFDHTTKWGSNSPGTTSSC
jgi:uncharacterized protein YjbI with pentapeptide repeats